MANQEETRAVDALEAIKENQGRLGVFWHTQRLKSRLCPVGGLTKSGHVG